MSVGRLTPELWFVCADLARWHYEGLVFNGTAQMTGMPVDPPYRIERPKVRWLCTHNFDVLLSWKIWSRLSISSSPS